MMTPVAAIIADCQALAVKATPIRTGPGCRQEETRPGEDCRGSAVAAWITRRR